MCTSWLTCASISESLQWRCRRWTIHEWRLRAISDTIGMPVCWLTRPTKFTFSLCWPHPIESFTSLTKVKKQQTDRGLQFTAARIIATCFITWIDRPEMGGSIFLCFCIALYFLAACNLEDAIAPIHLPADGESFTEIGHAMPIVTAGHGMNKLHPTHWSYSFPSLWS